MARRLTFRQLEVLSAVAEHNGYAAAARALGISQPAVTKHVDTLERALGQSLFVRTPGGASRLTKHGRQVVSALPGLMQQYRALSPTTVAAEGLPSIVRIGCGDHLAELIGDLMPRLHRKHPHVRVHVRQLDPALASVLHLDAQDVDIAYLTLRHRPPEGIGEVLVSTTANLYASPAMIRACRRAPDRPLPLISAGDTSFLSREFEARLVQIGIRSHFVAFRLPTQSARVKLAVAGLGVVHAMEPTVRRHVARGRLRVFATADTIMYRCRFVSPLAYRDPNVRLVEAFLSRELSRL